MTSIHGRSSTDWPGVLCWVRNHETIWIHCHLLRRYSGFRSRRHKAKYMGVVFLIDQNLLGQGGLPIMNPRAPRTFLEGVWGGFRGSKYLLRRYLEPIIYTQADVFPKHNRWDWSINQARVVVSGSGVWGGSPMTVPNWLCLGMMHGGSGDWPPFEVRKKGTHVDASSGVGGRASGSLTEPGGDASHSAMSTG